MTDEKSIFQTQQSCCANKFAHQDGFIATSTGKCNEIQITKGLIAKVEEMNVPSCTTSEVKKIKIIDNNNNVLLSRCECTNGNCICIVESCELDHLHCK
ncbi:MAG: hypothetical protein D3923_00420 [Candidatus Electrothrix sp. AR3]|nr:hypothetical protein [Candidatus Electrothrix sp. AR3]